MGEDSHFSPMLDSEGIVLCLAGLAAALGLILLTAAWIVAPVLH